MCRDTKSVEIFTFCIYFIYTSNIVNVYWRRRRHRHVCTKHISPHLYTYIYTSSTIAFTWHVPVWCGCKMCAGVCWLVLGGKFQNLVQMKVPYTQFNIYMYIQTYRVYVSASAHYIHVLNDI